MSDRDFLKELSFEEKATLISFGDVLYTKSVDVCKIPVLQSSDGPHGVRKISENGRSRIEGNNTCFPTASALGATWNKEIAFEVGAAIADDCTQENIDFILGPAINMKRTPHCGRNFEYISEDPYLSGILGAEYVKGAQSKGIGTCVKHFAANNQEINRGIINVEVDERTLREYYLKPFEILLKNCNPTSVMCAYNKINGIWCSENEFLLRQILRDEWKYDGLVVSDWGAVHNIAKAIHAGLNYEMPNNSNAVKTLKEALVRGEITENDLDEAVLAYVDFAKRLLDMKKLTKKEGYSRAKQHEIAYRGACESITLLKNNNNALPLTKDKYNKIIILGSSAKTPQIQGGGSSRTTVSDAYIDSPIEYIINNSEGITIDYIPLFDGMVNDERIQQKVASVVGEYDCAVMFVANNYGSDGETESFDRDNLKLPNYVNAAISKMAEKCKNSVLVLQSGGPIIPYRWDNVSAVVQMWYSGEASGRAIADILFGIVNPSGKLSETFIKSERTDIDYPGDGIKVKYDEKLNVGYRYYDRHPVDVYFPFGHGLSYTEFDYSDINISSADIVSDRFSISVSCKIKNIGNVVGKEIIQLYIGQLDNIVDKPMKELKGFEKIELEPGEEKTVTFALTNEDFSYYNVCMHRWHVESGRYKIYIASSLADVRLEESVSILNERDYTKDMWDRTDIPV